MGLAEQAELSYKRVGRNNVQITYRDGKDTTVVVAKTVRRGAYVTCDNKSSGKTTAVGRDPAVQQSHKK